MNVDVVNIWEVYILDISIVVVYHNDSFTWGGSIAHRKVLLLAVNRSVHSCAWSSMCSFGHLLVQNSIAVLCMHHGHLVTHISSMSPGRVSARLASFKSLFLINIHSHLVSTRLSHLLLVMLSISLTNLRSLPIYFLLRLGSGRVRWLCMVRRKVVSTIVELDSSLQLGLPSHFDISFETFVGLLLLLGLWFNWVLLYQLSWGLGFQLRRSTMEPRVIELLVVRPRETLHVARVHAPRCYIVSFWNSLVSHLFWLHHVSGHAQSFLMASTCWFAILLHCEVRCPHCILPTHILSFATSQSVQGFREKIVEGWFSSLKSLVSVELMSEVVLLLVVNPSLHVLLDPSLSLLGFRESDRTLSCLAWVHLSIIWNHGDVRVTDRGVVRVLVLNEVWVGHPGIQHLSQRLVAIVQVSRVWLDSVMTGGRLLRVKGTSGLVATHYALLCNFGL